MFAEWAFWSTPAFCLASSDGDSTEQEGTEITRYATKASGPEVLLRVADFAKDWKHLNY